MVRDIQKNIIGETIMFDIETCADIEKALNNKTPNQPSNFIIEQHEILSLIQEDETQYSVCINGAKKFTSNNYNSMKIIYEKLIKSLDSILNRVRLLKK